MMVDRLEQIKTAIEQIVSDSYYSKQLNKVDSAVGDALEVVMHNTYRYVELYGTIENKIKALKQLNNYPYNFTGQMVEDFEWVLDLMK